MSVFHNLSPSLPPSLRSSLLPSVCPSLPLLIAFPVLHSFPSILLSPCLLSAWLILVLFLSPLYQLQILALIALSLVAGFSVNPSLSFMCITGNFSYTFRVGYAFGHLEQNQVVNATDRVESTLIISDKGIQQSAQFFVAWGALTLLYCIVAILVYMLVTANEALEKAFDFLVATVSLTLCVCTWMLWLPGLVLDVIPL